MIGRRLGHYEVIEELGRGGMGVVYLARQDGLDRLVAVKVLAAVDAELAARLRREARVLSELHHPHIVSIYDVGEVSGSPYFVMAYCAGGSVADVLAQQGRLTVGQAVNVLASTSSALAAMHSLGLVHRDVKPSNVLLSADGQPFLSDLGIVGGGDRSRMTATGSLLGTIGYSAPELLDNAHHSPACDTFSLGVLGYEIVSGRHPFARPSLSGVLDAVRRGVYPPLAELAPGVPTRLAELITSAMSIDPGQRPPDLDRLSHTVLTVAAPERVRVVHRDAGTQRESARSLDSAAPAAAHGPDHENMRARIEATGIRATPLPNSVEPTPSQEPASPASRHRLSRALGVVVAAVAIGAVATVVVSMDEGSMRVGTKTDYATSDLPYGIVFDGTNIWITNVDVNTVSKMDPATGAKTDYPTGDGPDGIVFDGASIWITNFRADTVSKMNPATGAKTDYPTGDGPDGIVFDGASIWITNSNGNTVSKMNPATGIKIDYPTGDGPDGIVFDGASIWITNSDGDTVSKMYPHTGIKTDYPTGDTPNGIVFDGTSIWITNLRADTVSKMNPVTGAKTDYPTGDGPFGIVFDGTSIWITNVRADTVSKMNPVTGAKTDYPTGKGPNWIVFDGTSIWITNSDGDTVSKMVP